MRCRQYKLQALEEIAKPQVVVCDLPHRGLSFGTLHADSSSTASMFALCRTILLGIVVAASTGLGWARENLQDLLRLESRSRPVHHPSYRPG
jgi:hypothetical protein